MDDITVNLILDKIDSLEKSMSDKIDNLGALFDQKVNAIKAENEKITEALHDHEVRLDGHDREINALQHVWAIKAKELMITVLKFAGTLLLAYVVLKVFPGLNELISWIL